MLRHARARGAVAAEPRVAQEPAQARAPRLHHGRVELAHEHLAREREVADGRAERCSHGCPNGCFHRGADDCAARGTPPAPDAPSLPSSPRPLLWSQVKALWSRKAGRLNPTTPRFICTRAT